MWSATGMRRLSDAPGASFVMKLMERLGFETVEELLEDEELL